MQTLALRFAYELCGASEAVCVHCIHPSHPDRRGFKHIPKPGRGKGQLRKYRVVAAKTHLILHEKLYPNVQEAKRMRALFNYDQQYTNIYIAIEEHFGNGDVLAIIPTKMLESKNRAHGRYKIVVQLLDLAWLTSCGPRLECYGMIIDTIAERQVPNEKSLVELISWIAKTID